MRMLSAPDRRGQRRMWTVTLTIVPPAKTVPPNQATAAIGAVCPLAASRQMAIIAKSATMAGVTWLTWARRDTGLAAVLFRDVATGFISRDFARADGSQGDTGESSVVPSAVQSSGAAFGAPLLRLGPRWSAESACPG